jgi:hypothetical protein
MFLPKDETAALRESINRSVFFKYFGRFIMLLVVAIPLFELAYLVFFSC